MLLMLNQCWYLDMLIFLSSMNSAIWFTVLCRPGLFFKFCSEAVRIRHPDSRWSRARDHSHCHVTLVLCNSLARLPLSQFAVPDAIYSCTASFMKLCSYEALHAYDTLVLSRNDRQACIKQKMIGNQRFDGFGSTESVDFLLHSSNHFDCAQQS